MDQKILSVSVEDLAGVIGQRKAVGLCRVAKGVIYIPKHLKSGVRLVEIIGLADSCKMADRWGSGHRVLIPQLAEMTKAKRNEKMVRQFRDGAKCAALAEQYGLTARRVRKVLRSLPGGR